MFKVRYIPITLFIVVFWKKIPVSLFNFYTASIEVSARENDNQTKLRKNFRAKSDPFPFTDANFSIFLYNVWWQLRTAGDDMRSELYLNDYLPFHEITMRRIF